jgi:phosphatidylglycerophosphatase A
VNRVAVAIATCFGCGYFPWGPGTIGSLAAIMIAIVLRTYGGMGRPTLLVLTLLLLLPAIWASTRTARLLDKKDPSVVVIDEVLGQWVTLLGATALRWKSFCAAFLFFRLFDIWKPWPVRSFEKLPEGAGILADDLAAGMYAALILYIGGKLRLY